MSEQRIDRWDALMNKHKSIRPSNGLMALGYECGNGWLPILEDLFAEIDKEARAANITEITILQVKEKFGGLVVAVDNGNDVINALIKAATKKAATTCEGCGKPGKKMDYNGWYKTLCSKCYASRN